MSLAAFAHIVRVVRPAGPGIRGFVDYALALLSNAPVGRDITRVASRWKRARVSVGGYNLVFRPHSGDLGLLLGNEEPKTAQWFRVRTGDVVIDVGAHIGRYTLLAADHASHVIAVEPAPENFAILEANILLNRLSNVTLYRCAVSDRRGTGTLYLPRSGNTVASLDLKWVERHGPCDSAVLVECRTLDDIVAELGIEHIDWLKIDVEGHELRVLEGATQILQHTKNVIVEVSPETEAACVAKLRTMGFSIVGEEARPAAIVPVKNVFFTREPQER